MDKLKQLGGGQAGHWSSILGYLDCKGISWNRCRCWDGLVWMEAVLDVDDLGRVGSVTKASDEPVFWSLAWWAAALAMFFSFLVVDLYL